MSNFEIFCEKEQMAKIEEHCFSETQIEVGGFLIGKVEEGKTTVTAAVAAKHTIGQSTQLTFTHDTWDAIYKFMEKLPDDEKLIGWYHSHPNFGVFLSEHDQFIQNNFFKSPGQITIVVDPIRGRRGWFTSVDGKIVKHGEEEDTMKKKLGVSSTNADANMDVVLGTRAPSASNLKIIGISALMATLSFVAGLLVNNVSKIDKYTSTINSINTLQKQVKDLQDQITSLTLNSSSNGSQGSLSQSSQKPKATSQNQAPSIAKKTKGKSLVNENKEKTQVIPGVAPAHQTKGTSGSTGSTSTSGSTGSTSTSGSTGSTSTSGSTGSTSTSGSTGSTSTSGSTGSTSTSGSTGSTSTSGSTGSTSTSGSTTNR